MQLAKQEVNEVKERGGFDKSNITIFFILLLQRLLRKLKYFSKPTRTKPIVRYRLDICIK